MSNPRAVNARIEFSDGKCTERVFEGWMEAIIGPVEDKIIAVDGDRQLLNMLNKVNFIDAGQGEMRPITDIRRVTWEYA